MGDKAAFNRYLMGFCMFLCIPGDNCKKKKKWNYNCLKFLDHYCILKWFIADILFFVSME